MKQALLLTILQTFFYFLNSAHANPCSIETGDGDVAAGSAPLTLKFNGPINPFWSYVSSEPKTWSFKISETSDKVLNPGFEQFAVIIGKTEKTFELKNDLIFLSKNEFYVKPGKVLEILAAYKASTEDHRKKTPVAVPVPPAANQLLHFYITFNSPSKKATENWLNYSCTVGIGLNSLAMTFLNHDLKKQEQDLNFDVETNAPEFDGAWGISLPSKFKLQSKLGETHVEGLPIGTFVAKIEGLNEKIPISYMWNLNKKCSMKFLKDKLKTSWKVTENSCSTQDRLTR